MEQGVFAATATLPTRHGTFTMHVFKGRDHHEQIALAVGPVDDGELVPVRIHSECMTGDVFGSQRCDCGQQLDESMRLMQSLGRGVLLYMRQEGRGIGLTNKILAYALQEGGLDTVDANRALGLPDDAREYHDAAAMLQALHVQQIALITNNPAKIDGLRRLGIDVADRWPLHITPNPDNEHYILTKQYRMGHLQPTLELNQHLDRV